MTIKKGDRFVHRQTGMKCKAAANEDSEGMVMTKQKGGSFASCPAADLVPDNTDIPITSTGTADVVARKSQAGGGYQTIVKDKKTGAEKHGAVCPGDPDDFDYNEVTDSWSAKP